MKRALEAVMVLFLMMVQFGCAGPEGAVFEMVDGTGDPVVGAHARIIVLDAGAPLPLSRRALEEAAHVTAATGGFTDRRGRVALPVVGDREHLIEVEGPVLGVERSGEGFWVWVLRADGSVVRSGQGEDGMRMRRVD